MKWELIWAVRDGDRFVGDFVKDDFVCRAVSRPGSFGEVDQISFHSPTGKPIHRDLLRAVPIRQMLEAVVLDVVGREADAAEQARLSDDAFVAEYLSGATRSQLSVLSGYSVHAVDRRIRRLRDAGVITGLPPSGKSGRPRKEQS